MVKKKRLTIREQAIEDVDDFNDEFPCLINMTIKIRLRDLIAKIIRRERKLGKDIERANRPRY